MLKPKIENGCIRAVYDGRYARPVDITDGGGTFGQPVYTLKSQDITKEPKPPFTPYTSRTVPSLHGGGGRRAAKPRLRRVSAAQRGGRWALPRSHRRKRRRQRLHAIRRHEVVKLHNKIGSTLK